MFVNPSPESLCAMLRSVRTIAVVGLSPKPERPSHYVSRTMQGWGFRIIPVHPAVDSILGEKAYASLAEIPEPIDLVNVFRAARYLEGIVDECLARGVTRLWIQEGIVDEAAALRARERGMEVVMNRCIMRDYHRYCRE